MKIGFIGPGIMGRPMSRNLVAAGHELTVSDHNQPAVAELVELGAQRGDTPKEIAQQVDLVITVLPNSPNVKVVALEAIRGGLAGSTVLEAKAPMMLARNFKPGFRIDLHINDLTNALETSHEAGVPRPLTAAVLEMFTALKADGHATDDHSGLVQYYEMLANTQIETSAL